MSSESKSKSHRIDEFTELSGACQLQLLGYIYSTLRNLDDAEDVYQQTCIIMWRKFDEYESGTDFLKWACTIARYEVLNFIRSRKNQARYFSDDFLENIAPIPRQENMARGEARQRALAGCLGRLKKTDHQLIMRCYRGRGKILDVAKEIGRPADSVYSSLRRIRSVLYDCINRTLALEGIDE